MRPCLQGLARLRASFSASRNRGTVLPRRAVAHGVVQAAPIPGLPDDSGIPGECQPELAHAKRSKAKQSKTKSVHRPGSSARSCLGCRPSGGGYPCIRSSPGKPGRRVPKGWRQNPPQLPKRQKQRQFGPWLPTQASLCFSLSFWKCVHLTQARRITSPNRPLQPSTRSAHTTATCNIRQNAPRLALWPVGGVLAIALATSCACQICWTQAPAAPTRLFLNGAVNKSFLKRFRKKRKVHGPAETELVYEGGVGRRGLGWCRVWGSRLHNRWM